MNYLKGETTMSVQLSIEEKIRLYKEREAMLEQMVIEAYSDIHKNRREWVAKFNALGLPVPVKAPNRCSWCGTEKNLHYEGSLLGYRCDQDDCAPF
jgi:hypothetical protein